jgi:NADH-quinone oxidoreductase subunit A
MSPTSLVAYLVLFAAVGFSFLLVSLLVGRLLRINAPTPQKMESYECGEPPVGSAFVQFDLRFYVVALVFIIFEVEVALFFPPATIFGTATQVMALAQVESAHDIPSADVSAPSPPVGLYRELGIPSDPTLAQVVADVRLLALASMADLGAFFAVILLGFAYVWWRGDLNWVRAVGREQSGVPTPGLKLLA